MCEKPLALTLAECDRIASACERSGRVLQVAYMKRFDPAYRRALDFLPPEDRGREADLGRGQRSRPGALRGPSADDGCRRRPRLPCAANSGARMPSSSANPHAANSTKWRQRALSGGFLSSLVHDVAVVHGMLAHIGADLPAEADVRRDLRRRPRRAARLSAPRRRAGEHDAPQPAGRPRLHRKGDRLLHRPHRRADLPLALSAPYADAPDGAPQGGGDAHELETSEYRVSYEEAFREELRAFHAAATGKRRCNRRSLQARRDVELLTSAFRKAVAK